MFRYVILLITLLCMSFMLSNFILFYFTVICMDPIDVSDSRSYNETVEFAANMYSPLEESWIFSALAVGRIAGALPTILMINKFGLGTTLTSFGIISGMSTFSMPIVAHSLNLVLGLRFAQGLGSASLFVAHGAVPLAWGGAAEQGVFVSFLSCAYEIAPIMANSLSGYFCTSSFGWPGVYYLFGVLTTVCFVLFAFFYSDSDVSNRLKTSPSNRIQPTEPTLPPKPKQPVPYKAMLKSPSVWGVWMTALGDAVAYQMFSMYAPTYINKVLGFDVSNTGILAALPFLLAIGVKSFGGIFLDKATCIPSPTRVLGFTSFFQGTMTVCFCLLTLMTENDRILAQIILTLAICSSGLHCVGFFTCSQIVAQQFNHVLSAGFAVLNAVIALLLPILVAFVAPNHSNEEWAIVFYYMIAALVATNVAFVVLTKVKPAKWTKKDMKDSLKYYDYS